MTRKDKPFLVTLVATIGIAGCVGIIANAKTTLTYSTWGNTDEVAMEEKIVKAFEAANPDIDIKLIVPVGNYEEKLTVMLAAGEAPDVIALGRGWLPEFSSALQPIEGHGINSDIYATPNIPKSLIYKGKQMGLPKRMNTKVMVYDKNAFDRAGVVIPKGTITPETYADLAKKLTARTNDKVQRWGSGPMIIWNWFSAFGAEYIDDDNGKALLTKPEMVEATKYMASLHKKYAGWFDDFSDFNKALVGGGMAMFADVGPWYLPAFTASSSFNWIIAPTPGKPLEPESVGLSIAKSTKHYNEALKFAKFVSTSTEAQSIIAAGTNLPVTKIGMAKFVDKVPGKSLDKFYDPAENYKFPELAKKKLNLGNITGLIWDTFYNEILKGKVEPYAGLQNLNSTIQNLLNSFNKK